ncbi:MAG TPA: hypothetical protein PLA72_09670 [Smithellaceae bacterium]|nr:hypothetical protein [Smithellaceae bacterium]
MGEKNISPFCGGGVCQFKNFLGCFSLWSTKRGARTKRGRTYTLQAMCAETKPKNELDQWPKKYFVLVGFVLIFFSVLVVFRGWLKTVFIFLWSRFLRPKIFQNLFFFF